MWTCLNPVSAKRYYSQRFFAELDRFGERTGRVAVADWSMQFENRPDTADDGLLWVDPSCPIVINEMAITIPLLSVRDGNRMCRATTDLRDIATVLDVADLTGARVVVLLKPALQSALDAVAERMTTP